MVKQQGDSAGDDQGDDDDPLDAVSDEVARAWLERSRAAQGLPMIVDDFDIVSTVVRLMCGDDQADDQADDESAT